MGKGKSHGFVPRYGVYSIMMQRNVDGSLSGKLVRGHGKKEMVVGQSSKFEKRCFDIQYNGIM